MDDDIGVDLDVVMEEEVPASVSHDATVFRVSYDPIIPQVCSHQTISSSVDSMKCLWCQTITDERESVLGRGLATFLEHCKAIGRPDLVEYIRLTPDCEHFVHRSCNRSMAYSTRKARTKVCSSSETNVRVATCSSTGCFFYAQCVSSAVFVARIVTTFARLCLGLNR